MSHSEPDRPRLLVNAARVPNVGGLKSFSESLIRCLEDEPGVVVLRPQGQSFNTSLRQETVPSWLAPSSRISPLRPILWSLFSLSDVRTMRAKRILGATHQVLPFHKRQIVTVHDVRPYYYPDSPVQAFYWRKLMPGALRRCNGILTVSETSKQEISNIYGLDISRIYVVPNVVDTKYFVPALGENRERPYLLAVGSSFRHKNVIELLQMHSLWAPEYRLKIVAGRGQYADLLQRLSVELGIAQSVEFFFDVPLEQLRHLYQQCAALVFPSMMEGFGLPPLEAMACGRPVIVADEPFARELYGGVPLFVQRSDKDSWCQAFHALRTYSQERTDRGIEVARSYSQDRMRFALKTALNHIWGSEFRQL